MDALSRLLMLNAPQGTIDKNCVLGSVTGSFHMVPGNYRLFVGMR